MSEIEGGQTNTAERRRRRQTDRQADDADAERWNQYKATPFYELEDRNCKVQVTQFERL